MRCEDFETSADLHDDDDDDEDDDDDDCLRYTAAVEAQVPEGPVQWLSAGDAMFGIGDSHHHYPDDHCHHNQDDHHPYHPH